MPGTGRIKLRLSDQSVREYLLQGRAPRPGEIFHQPTWRTWRELGRHGRDYFAGDLARKIVAASWTPGAYLQLPDLAGQRSEWMDPIRDLPRPAHRWKCRPTGRDSSS
jgi:gamma-glutamyltranspeptidase